MRSKFGKLSTRLLMTLAFALLATLAIPATPASAQIDNHDHGPESDEGFVLSTVRWENREVNVCWENQYAVGYTERDLVIIGALQWADVANIDFVGWNDCQPNDRGIRILWEDSGPHVKGLGNQLDGVPNGMVLNSTFENWCQFCGVDRLGSIYKIAVHEFGHALGLAHEQNRDDTPDNCFQHPQGTDGDTKIGPWDLFSVMNYCNPEWNGNGTLSETDIAAARFLYPFSPGTLDIRVSARDAHLSWTLPDDPKVNGAWIVLNSEPGFWVRGDSLSHSFEGLEQGDYTVKVWATRAGVRDPILIKEERFSITTSEPTRLVVGVRGTSVQLSWHLPDDPAVNGSWVVLDSEPGTWHKYPWLWQRFDNLAPGEHTVKVWATREGNLGPLLVDEQKFEIAD